VHNEELHDVDCSPNVIQVTKSRRTRWAGNVACMGKRISAYRVLVRKTEEKR
jgi:hypothetical protein